MSDNSAATGAILYVATIIAARYLTQATQAIKAASRLPRPKSFLLSGKNAPNQASDSAVKSLPVVSQGIFVPKCTLCVKDSIVIEMLNQQTEKCCFTVSDPNLHSNPLIFASDAFCTLTGYTREEIILRNCRFLQGSATDRVEVARISKAIREGREGSACLLNHKKGGDMFINQLFICPLFDEAHRLVYFLGVQAEVESMGPGQQPENAGWNLNNSV